MENEAGREESREGEEKRREKSHGDRATMKDSAENGTISKRARARGELVSTDKNYRGNVFFFREQIVSECAQ